MVKDGGSYRKLRREGRDWREWSYWGPEEFGRKVRVTVGENGVLFRSTWRNSGDFISCWFLPRCYFEAMDFSNVLEICYNMLTKPTKTEVALSVSPTVEDPDFQAGHPTLFAFLCDTTYQDGSPRQTATITFFQDQGALKGCCNDRDNGRSLFVTGQTLLDLLESMDAALSDPKTVWKPSAGSYDQPRGRRGKKD